MSGRALLAAVLITAACRQGAAPGGAAGEDVPASVQEGKAQLEKGQLDAALASLQKEPDHPESLYWQGRVWAKKAETAPLPAPEPPPSPMPRGWEPAPPPGFKPEELQALALFERAIAARPNHAPSHLAVADLLAPHAAHRHDLAEAAAQEAARRKRGATPQPLPALQVDASTDRVIREYQIAAQADPAASAAADGLLRFARRVRRFDAAEAAFGEQLKRAKEAQSAEVMIRFGDFLATEKKDLAAAVEQYRQALIWRPEDDGTRAKIADIYISMGTEYYQSRQYAVAEQSFKEAARWVTDRTSTQARAVEDYQRRLKSVRK
jgi:tetratricopeptide (TPR) repeat protein